MELRASRWGTCGGCPGDHSGGCHSQGFKSIDSFKERSRNAREAVLGITGVGGAGKSSLTDEIIRRALRRFRIDVSLYSVDRLVDGVEVLSSETESA